MTIRKPILFVGAIVLVVAVIGLSFVLDNRSPAVPTDVSTSTPITYLPGGFAVSGDATVTEVTVPNGITPPSLTRPITFTGSPVPPEAQAGVRVEMENVITSLKTNPSHLDLWLRLGAYYKQAGDYQGAAEAWGYVSAVAPTDEISAGNLGDLYMNFIKDYPKAEASYKRAIANNGEGIDYYRSLYTLYRYLYKVGTNADRAIVEEGLKKNPGNQDLLTLKAELEATP